MLHLLKGLFVGGILNSGNTSATPSYKLSPKTSGDSLGGVESISYVPKNSGDFHESRALQSALTDVSSYDLLAEPLIHTGNINQASECGSVIKQVNGYELNSTVNDIAVENRNIINNWV